MGWLQSLLSILDALLSLFREHELMERGRRDAQEELRLKSTEAREIALEVDRKPAPSSESDILDRM